MGLFGKLFGRRPLVVPETEPVFVREPEPDFEEDWDWQIAYARNRPKTEPVQRAAPQPVTRRAAVHAVVQVPAIPIPNTQPGTVIPVPMLPVASDPSQVRLRQDTRPTALPMPRHMRFARGTDRHDTHQDEVTKVPVAAPSSSRPPPLPPQLRSGRR